MAYGPTNVIRRIEIRLWVDERTDWGTPAGFDMPSVAGILEPWVTSAGLRNRS